MGVAHSYHKLRVKILKNTNLNIQGIGKMISLMDKELRSILMEVNIMACFKKV